MSVIAKQYPNNPSNTRTRECDTNAIRLRLLRKYHCHHNPKREKEPVKSDNTRPHNRNGKNRIVNPLQ